jgi:hypothetical protein
LWHRRRWKYCRGEVGGTYDFLLTWSASYLTASVRMAVREWIPFN